MFTATELKLLCCLNKEYNTIADLKEKTGLSQAQVYNIIRELKRKSVLKDTKEIEVSENICAIRLVNLMEDYPNLSDVLSDNGIDILIEFIEPHTANEVIYELNLSKATVFRKIKVSKSVGILVHDGNQYYVNEKLWPELIELLTAINDMRSVYDDRAPAGSRILINKKDRLIYSNRDYDDGNYTAFSYFIENDDLPIVLDTNYYSTEKNIDLDIAFRDAYDITKRLNDRRLRMGLLMEYMIHEDDIDAPVNFLKIYEDISKGKDVKGWPSSKEVELRISGWK